MGQHSVVKAARSRASVQVFQPFATLRCEGPRLFRSQGARDLACLLDVNPAVSSWTCMPFSLETATGRHVPDFAVFNVSGSRCLFDAHDRVGDVDPEALSDAADQIDWKYRLVQPDEVYSGPRLRNVKDLLRYADHVTPLGDRVRVLAAFDEVGSMTFAECLQLFREGRSMAGLASMILREQMLEIDLDDDLIGPETQVRRIRR